MNRRALLAAGGAALLAGCGAAKDAGDTTAEVIARQLAAAQATAAAYAGLRDRRFQPELDRLHARARARVTTLRAALRAAGGSPAAAPAPPARPGLERALEAETRELQAHVAATGRTRDPALRALLGTLIAGTARHQALLMRLLGQDPLQTAFPGEASA